MRYVGAKERRRATLRAVDAALERLSRDADGPDDRPDEAPDVADEYPGSAERPVDEWRSRFEKEVEHAYSIVGRRGCEHVPDADLFREGTRLGYVLARAELVEGGYISPGRDLRGWIPSRYDWFAGEVWLSRAARAELAHSLVSFSAILPFCTTKLQ